MTDPGLWQRDLEGDGGGYAVAGGAVGLDGIALPGIADAGGGGSIEGDLVASGGGLYVAEAVVGLADFETVDSALMQGLVKGEDDVAVFYLGTEDGGEGS